MVLIVFFNVYSFAVCLCVLLYIPYETNAVIKHVLI